MTTIYIKDTGIVKVGSESGTALTGTNIVNGGTEIPLKVIRIRYGRGIRLDNTPNPGTFTEPELNFTSVTSPVIVLEGEIRKDGTLSSSLNVINKITDGGTTSVVNKSGSTVSDEIEMLGLLDRLTVTKGYKELYFKSTIKDNIIYGVGATDNHSTTGQTYRHLHVRVKSIDINEAPDSKLISW